MRYNMLSAQEGLDVLVNIELKQESAIDNLMDDYKQDLIKLEQLETGIDKSKLSEQDLFILESITLFGQDKVEELVRYIHGDEVWEAMVEDITKKTLLGHIISGLGTAITSIVVTALRLFADGISKLTSKAKKTIAETARVTFNEVSDHFKIGKIVANAISESGFWLSNGDAREIVDTLIEWGENFLTLSPNDVIQDFVKRKASDTLDQYYPKGTKRNQWWYDETTRELILFSDKQKSPPLSSLITGWEIDDLRYVNGRMAGLERLLMNYHRWLSQINNWLNSQEGKQFFSEQHVAQLPDNEQVKRKDDIQMLQKLIIYIKSWGVAALKFDSRYRMFEMYCSRELQQVVNDRDSSTEGLKEIWNTFIKKFQKKKEDVTGLFSEETNYHKGPVSKADFNKYVEELEKAQEVAYNFLSDDKYEGLVKLTKPKSLKKDGIHMTATEQGINQVTVYGDEFMDPNWEHAEYRNDKGEVQLLKINEKMEPVYADMLKKVLSKTKWEEPKNDDKFKTGKNVDETRWYPVVTEANHPPDFILRDSDGAIAAWMFLTADWKPREYSFEMHVPALNAKGLIKE